MDVFQALQQRRSVRAFLPQVPSADTVRALMEGAASAASGGNMQPWRVVALTGEPLAQAIALAAQAQPQEHPERLSYPENLWEPYRSRRFDNGEALYQSIGAAREDKVSRLVQLAKNTTFFGAPVGLFVLIDERMSQPQWVDLGIYLQSLMLLAVEQGLATCAQGFWRRYEHALTEHLQIPKPYCIAFGVALGYEDTTAPINTLRANRAPLEEWAQLRGF